MSCNTRSAIYRHDAAYTELRLAYGFRAAANAASVFGANQHLVNLYREWMRIHALAAVRMARANKTS